MTLIEISEKIRDHLIQQGRVSSDNASASMCLYRTEDGAKCAVGCLINDDLYISKMEHNPASAQIVKDAVCKSLGIEWSDMLAYVLKEWQFYHDTYYGRFLDDTDTRSPEQTHQSILAYLKAYAPA